MAYRYINGVDARGRYCRRAARRRAQVWAWVGVGLFGGLVALGTGGVLGVLLFGALRNWGFV